MYSGPQADELQQLRRRGRCAPCALPTPWTSSGSPTMSSSVMRGLSDENGSWKIICICRRSGCSRLLRQRSRRRSPPHRRVQAASARRSASIARRMQRDVVVLPQPLSPTSDSVSPWLRKNVTSSTAFTWPTIFCSKPRRIGKYFFSPLTSRSTLAVRAVTFDAVTSAHVFVQEAARLWPSPTAARGRLGGVAAAGHERRRSADGTGSPSAGCTGAESSR